MRIAAYLLLVGNPKSADEWGVKKLNPKGLHLWGFGGEGGI